MRLWLLCIFSILPVYGFSQFDSLGINTKWNEGIIVLSDATLKGFVKHNDKLQLIKFKEKLSDAEELSIQERNIIAMEYFDSGISDYRKFLMLNVREEQSGFKGAILFEIIIELKNFGVISKRHGVNPAIRTRSSYGTGLTKVGYEQFEKIGLVDKDGKAELLLVTNELERNKLKPFASKIKPYFNKSLLVKHIGPKWKEVNSYVKKNRLKLKRRAHLIQAFKYYQELEKAEKDSIVK